MDYSDRGNTISYTEAVKIIRRCYNLPRPVVVCLFKEMENSGLLSKRGRVGLKIIKYEKDSVDAMDELKELLSKEDLIVNKLTENVLKEEGKLKLVSLRESQVARNTSKMYRMVGLW